jgi:3-dehydroquinate synthase
MPPAITKNIKIKTLARAQTYRIEIGSGLLDSSGEWAQRCLPAGTQRVMIVSDNKVYRLYGAGVRKAFQTAGFKVSIFRIGGGEEDKSTNFLLDLLSTLSLDRFTRSDAVVALGGGVVGDMAGFASAIYLRGIPFLQIPTTLLAQVDSSVGGKTGINFHFVKNSLGAFYQPLGVLIDVDTLQTLDPREMTAGFCEAIKQGAVASVKLFGQTKRFLETYPLKDARKRLKLKNNDQYKADLADLIKAQVSFKARIVAGDEREDLAKNDARSRKILNFGHTIGHALEKATNFRHLRHGEAVGYGMLAAAELSKNLDILDKNSLNLLRNVVQSAGTLPRINFLRVESVLQATAFDKKKAGNILTWVLLKGIGKPVLVTDKDIPKPLIMESIKAILK